MNLTEFFKLRGYDISGIISESTNNDKYLGWYRGFVNNFHRYYVYNGERQVFKDRYGLNIPKMLCERFADFLMNEKVQINLGNDKDTKTLNNLLQNNNFWVKANQGIEKTFALGTGAFLLSLDRQKQIKIQFINASNIYPLTYDNDSISECAFVNDTIEFNRETMKSQKIRNVQTHTLENEVYIIRNFRFIVGENDQLTEIQVDDIPPEIDTGGDFRWFIPIKPNIVNNLNMDSPFGIPIYANSLDTIKALDLTYDSFVNEIQNGRKRLFVTQEAMKVSGDGCFKNAFDPQDVLFYILDGNFSENKANYVQEVNGELRVTDLRNALRTDLEMLAMKLGLDGDYFNFEQGLTTKTATEVISENNKTFRTIKKHEQVLESAILELVRAIITIGNKEGIFSLKDDNITIDFDDSIIESKEQERLQDRQDLAIDTMSLKEYRMKWYGEDEATAKSKISEIKAQNNENMSLNFMDEEVN